MYVPSFLFPVRRVGVHECIIVEREGEGLLRKDSVQLGQLPSTPREMAERRSETGPVKD